MRYTIRLALVCALLVASAPGAWAAEKPAAVPRGRERVTSFDRTRLTAQRQTHAPLGKRPMIERSASGPVGRLRRVEPDAGKVSGSNVVVGFERGGAAKALKAAADLGGRVARKSKTGGEFAVVKVPQGADTEQFMERLRRRPGVRYVEPNGTVRAMLASNDPGFSAQWGLTKIGATAAWDISRGSGVTVAVIDTGVQSTHPDFGARVNTTNDYDFVNDDFSADDDQGHGTHVAGIVAATLNNSLGVAGVANLATILPVKVLDADGNGTDAAVADGIRHAADNGADIINLSLGGEGDSETTRAAVQYAVSKDCVVVAATGNDSGYGVIYPAANANVIGVGSTTGSDSRSSFSNYGPQVDVVAPGSDIYSTLPGGDYGYMSGTSMATPHAAGVVALIRAMHPDWSRQQVEAQLLGSAKDLGAAGKDDYFGYGRIDAAAAVGTEAHPPPVIDDDDIDRAVPITPSPIIGTLDAATDVDDVYKVHLDAGETLLCSLTGAGGTHFQPLLYAPGTTTVWDHSGIVAGSANMSYPETFSYSVTSSGDYYLDAYAYAGSGEYSLLWVIRPPSTNPDDEIPGVAAPASPIAGTLEAGVDVDDVYALELNAGEVLSVSIDATTGTDYDAYLFGPDATSVWLDPPVAGAMGLGYPDSFSYLVPATGTYYLDAFCYAGSGAYEISYSVTPPEADFDIPGVPLSSSPQTGTLDSTSDWSDVYAIDLEVGETVSLWMTGTADTDFDVWLYGHSTTSVHDTSTVPLAWSYRSTYPEQLLYTARESGTYYVWASAYGGQGDYELHYTRSRDDEIPGVSLPGSPVVGTLNEGAGFLDYDDVYSVNLIAGQWLYLGLTGPANADFELYLHSVDATSVWSPAEVVAFSEGGASTERIMYRAQTSGTHYAHVYSRVGSGSYTLTHGKPVNQPTISLGGSTTVAYDGTASLSGTLRTQSGAALTGATVRLYRASPGSNVWSYVGSGSTSGSGIYTFSAKTATKSDYQVRYLGNGTYLDVTSARKTVTPKIHFSSAPRFSTYTHTYGKTYTVWGYIKPEHSTGSTQIKVKAYKRTKQSNGTYKYVWKKTYTTKISNSSTSSYSKYKGSVKLPSKGKWRLRAVHDADSTRATTYSEYRYVTVR